MRTSKPISKKSYSWKIILLFLIAASTLAVKINYYSPEKFQAVAQLKLKEKISENHPGMLAQMMNHPFSKTTNYEATLRNAVIDGVKNQNLNVEYFQIQPLFKTELYNCSPVTVSYSLKRENFYKQEFNLKHTYENNFVLSYEIDGITRERTGEFGKEIHEAELNFTVNKNPKMIPSRIEELLEKDLQFIIYSNEALADNLLKTSIDITSSENGTTNVSVTGSTPEKPMLLANNISESLLAKNAASNALDLINQQLLKVTEELQKARNEISGNRIETKPRETNSATTSSKAFANIEDEKKNLELLSTALENLSDSLRKNRNIPDATTDYGLINDPLITQYLDTLNEKITQRKNSTVKDTLKLSEEISSLQNTVAEIVRNTRKKVALQQDKINNIAATTNPAFAISPEKETNLQALNQNLFLTEKLYNYMVDKRTEIQGSLPFSTGSIVQKAILPHEPANADTTIVWIMAIFFGLMAGSITTFILNRFLELSVTNATIIENQNSISYFAALENGNKKELSTQFQNLCTKVLLLREVGEKQIITVTSASTGEGKTFIATHFAKSLASLDLKVLIIDMNLQHPSLEENFETQTSYTLADVLQKHIGAQEAVQITSIPGLDILTAGNLGFGINSLIAANGINKILNELKGHYDFIIIDASDTTRSMDAMPCMKFSNSTLFVMNAAADEQNVFNKVSQIKTEYHIEKIFFISNNIKYSKKQKSGKTIQLNAEKVREDNITKTPFLKKVALWFY